MMPGLYYPFDCFILLLVTVLYFISPTSWTGRKYPYLKWLLASLSLLTLIVFALKAIGLADKSTLTLWLFGLLSPVCLVTNLVFPFKKGIRNRTITFFAALITLMTIAAILCIWLWVAVSDM